MAGTLSVAAVYSSVGVSCMSSSRKCATRSLSMSVCPDSSSLAAAVCSAVVLFVCTTLKIWSMPTVTCAMDSDCSADASEMRQIMPVTFATPDTAFSSKAALCSAIEVPFCTAESALSISTAIPLLASEDLLARVRTSFAPASFVCSDSFRLQLHRCGASLRP